MCSVNHCLFYNQSLRAQILFPDHAIECWWKFGFGHFPSTSSRGLTPSSLTYIIRVIFYLFTESFYRFSLSLYRDSLENIDTVLFPTIAKNLTTTPPSLSMPQKQIQLPFQQSLESIFFKNSCHPETNSSRMC